MCMCICMSDRIWASFFNHPHKFLLEFHADIHRIKFSGERNCIQALILHSLVDFGFVLFFLSLQHHRHHHRYGIIKEHSLVMRLTLAIGRILAIHMIYSSWMLFQLFICESDEVCMHTIIQCVCMFYDNNDTKSKLCPLWNAPANSN